MQRFQHVWLGAFALLLLTPAAPSKAIFGTDICTLDITTIASLIGQPGQPYMYPIYLRDSGHPKAEKLCIDECKASSKACIALAKTVSDCQLTQVKLESAADAKNFCPADYIGDKPGEKMCKGYLSDMLKSAKANAKVAMSQAVAACEQYRDACIAVCGM